MDFVTRFRQSAPGREEVALFWLGQAGFLIKTPSGHSIAIDPYFSDYVMHSIPEEGLGFKRLTPPPCEAGDIPFDVLLISHEHGDHFDQESIGPMMANGLTQVYANVTACETMKGMPLDQTRIHVLKRGEPVDLPDCRLIPVDCDHGELAGEHGQWHKRSFYEGSQHVPLLIHVPGQEARRIGALVDPSVDLAPTILDYCGIDIPSFMQGQSLRRLIETGEDKEKREDVYYQVIGIEQADWNSIRQEVNGVANDNIRCTFGERGIRTKDWLYVEKEGAPFMLIDLKQDPGESFNLVCHASYIDKVL